MATSSVGLPGQNVRNVKVHIAHMFAFILVMLPIMPMFTVAATTVSPANVVDGACTQQTSCYSCVSSNIAFNCSWCAVLDKCSDGFDRYRQNWLKNDCSTPENYIDEIRKCPGYTPPPLTEALPPTKPRPSTEAPLSTEAPPPTEASPRTAKLSTAQLSTAQGAVATTKLKPKVSPTVDHCKNVPCQNDGVCEEGFCNCPPQYEGSRCQKFVTGHCEGIVCKNGGTCVQGITTHICDCPMGFSGRYCDVTQGAAAANHQGFGNPGLTVGAIVCIVLISVLVVGLFIWAVYAYRHPTSPSGLFILEAKHRIKGRGRGSNGVKYKYHQQMDSNQIDIQF